MRQPTRRGLLGAALAAPALVRSAAAQTDWPKSPIRWVVDPEGPLCPDAEDNALGGVVAAGDQFPTGHCHAPAHPGCRCGIAQTRR